MAYIKTTWRNNQSPAINADNLNHIEEGVYEAHQDIAENTQNIENLTTQTGANTSAIALEKTQRQQADTAETLARENADNLLSARMDTFTQLPSGSTSGDAELIDIRVGADGVTYPTAGDAVRGQVTDLKSDLRQLTSTTTTFSDGYISSADGQLKPATGDAQKTSDYIEVSNGFIIDVDITYTANRYRNAAIYGYDAGKKYIGRLALVDGGSYKQFTISTTIANESVRYIRFNFNTYGDTYTCSVNAYPNVRSNVLALQHEIKELPMSCLNLRDTIAWQKGDISSGSIIASTTRIVTTDIICKPYDIVLPFNADVFYMMWTYDDVQGSNPVWGGYVNMYNYAIYRIPYIIPANTCFRLIIRYTDTTISETDIRDAEIYKLVEMYEYGSYTTVAKSLRSTNIMSIAHQGMGTNPDDKGQSKMSALIRARNFGFSHIETDIQWSSDNVPVCCHDATFTDTNTSNTITIADHTLQELKTYGYYDETILSLEEVIAFCKENGMGLVIDHGYNFTNAQWSIAFALVNKYVMQDHVIWLVTAGTETGTFPNEWYSKAHIAVLSNSNDLTADIEYAQSIKTNFNHVYIDVNANVMTPTILANAIASLGADIKLIIWTIDRTDWLASFKPYVAGITSNTINCGLA